MSSRRHAGRVRSAYAFIKAHQKQFPVQVMCRLLEAAASGYADLSTTRVLECGTSPTSMSSRSPSPRLIPLSVRAVTRQSSGTWMATSCVVVTVYNGSAFTHQLGALGFPRIARIAPLFWKYADTFISSSSMQLPHYVRDYAGSESSFRSKADPVACAARPMVCVTT